MCQPPVAEKCPDSILDECVKSSKQTRRMKLPLLPQQPARYIPSQVDLEQIDIKSIKNVLIIAQNHRLVYEFLSRFGQEDFICSSLPLKRHIRHPFSGEFSCREVSSLHISEHPDVAIAIQVEDENYEIYLFHIVQIRDITFHIHLPLRGRHKLHIHTKENHFKWNAICTLKDDYSSASVVDDTLLDAEIYGLMPLYPWQLTKLVYWK